jgi:hypothetical protein
MTKLAGSHRINGVHRRPRYVVQVLMRFNRPESKERFVTIPSAATYWTVADAWSCVIHERADFRGD